MKVLVEIKNHMDKHNKGLNDVEWIRLKLDKEGHNLEYNGTFQDLLRIDDLDSVEYDDGYGWQQLYGTIWYRDGSWSERAEYDGSEWWRYVVRPPI